MQSYYLYWMVSKITFVLSEIVRNVLYGRYGYSFVIYFYFKYQIVSFIVAKFHKAYNKNILYEKLYLSISKLYNDTLAQTIRCHLQELI